MRKYTMLVNHVMAEMLLWKFYSLNTSFIILVLRDELSLKTKRENIQSVNSGKEIKSDFLMI